MDPSQKKIRSNLLRIVLGRTGFIAVAIIVQFFIVISYFGYLKDYSAILTGVLYFISFATLLYIINTNQNADYKIAWLLPVAIFPIFGALLYLFFKLQPTTTRINKKLEHNIARSKQYMKQDKQVLNSYSTECHHGYGFAQYMNNFAGYPIHSGTKVKYYPLGDDFFPDFLEQLEKAEKYIFLEYFIIDFGEVWDKTLEVLKKKAAEGVEVRVMYDGLCMISLLPYSYPKQLAEYNIKCRVFNPIRPLLSSSQNNRDHRKICVIDGKTGFTGGINLADEYMNIIERFGHWKDTAVMLEGSAVNNLTMMFLQMWNISETDTDEYAKYQTKADKTASGGYVLPFGDSPLDNESVGKSVYMNIINNAESYVHIITPYLIIDHEMETALIFAAKRGVDVKLILPHKPDKKYAFFLAHAHYPALINGGVKIYEYTPGFVHAKNYVSDNSEAVVGTINMDFRSLYLHWECGCYMYETDCIADIERDFCDTLKKCEKVTLADVGSFPLPEKILSRFLKIFAPLM